MFREKAKKKIFLATPCLILALYGHRPIYFRPGVALDSACQLDRHAQDSGHGPTRTCVMYRGCIMYHMYRGCRRYRQPLKQIF